MSSDDTRPITRAVAAAAIIVLAGAALLLQQMQSHFALHTDDAYITYRYAQHIAAGDGFVYNPGERILGTTTPLYTLILAGCARAGADIPATSAIINVAAGALTLMLAFLWLTQRTGRISVGLLGVVVLLSFEQFVQFSISGMETSLYALLILSTFMLYDAGRLTLAALLAGLCVLVRMDGAAVGAALMLHYLLVNRRPPPLRVWLGYAIVIIPWFAFAFWYFGDVRPQSMLAKNQHVLESSRYWMLEFLMRPTVAVLWPLFFLGVGAALRGRTPRPGIVALALWSAAYAAAFTLYRIDLYLWYLAPITVGIAVLVAYGIGAAAIALERQPAATATRVGTVVLMVVALAPALVPRLQHVRNVIRGAIDWSHTLEQSRADAADYVATHGSSADVIATGAIGIVGWKTQAYIHDVLGLVTRNAVGRPLDEVLRESQARWYISQVPGQAKAIPNIHGFDFIERYDRHPDIAFLLYERSGPGRPRAGGAQEVDLALTNGLTIESAEVSRTELRLTVVAREPIAEQRKFFVHVYRPTELDGAPAQICDAYPSPALPQLPVGDPRTLVIRFNEPLPDDGAVVRFGLFDESDPQFGRVLDADGNDGANITFSPVE